MHLNDISGKVIGAAYKVSNTLGAGFLEKVYENAMMLELKCIGLTAVQQKPIKVYYNGVGVGEYFADILIENSLIVELKAIKIVENIHLAQTMNYLKATNLKLGLIINFGNPKVEIKRVVNNF